MADQASTSKRRRRTREEWRDLLDEFSRCGQTQVAFCEHRGLSVTTLQNWKRKLSRAKRPRGGPRKPAFLPLIVNEPASGGDGDITVAWDVGRQLRVPLATSSERVAELVLAIESAAVPRS
jgi:transposase-like protein